MKALQHAVKFFQERYKFVLLFSIPFFVALLIPILVSAPTYVALGGVFLRTGSIPELDLLQVAFTILAYLVSMYLIADSIVNLNLLIKSQKTMTKVGREVVKAMGTYGVTVFLLYTFMALIVLVLQLLTFDFSLRSIVLPLLTLIMGFELFFVPPAVVIDGMKLLHAVRASVAMSMKKAPDILLWCVIGLVGITVSEAIFLFLPHPFGIYLTLLFNSVVVMPFLLVYQTFIYMKKYPLAN